MNTPDLANPETVSSNCFLLHFLKAFTFFAALGFARCWGEALRPPPQPPSRATNLMVFIVPISWPKPNSTF